jgi:hypothetical protein
MHYEGRQYRGLIRHLILSLVVLGFVSIHTDRVRGKNPQVTLEHRVLHREARSTANPNPCDRCRQTTPG